jgi:hypothetical protein|tara:strand:+ start:231 stop:503 length:273 start_codon:yes stop_codon:yes gene_type:complete
MIYQKIDGVIKRRSNGLRKKEKRKEKKVMVTKADKNEMRISKHEEVCSERYRNIHENISDLKSRIKRLEGIIMLNTVAVVCALISVFTKL